MADSSVDMHRTVVVTGSGAGIGYAVTAAFVALGCHVVGVDQRPTEHASESVVGDVRDPTVHQRAVAAALQATGRVDVLVANAGVHDGGAGLSSTPDDLAATLRAVHDVNVVGAVLAIQACAEPLRHAHGSVVVTLSDAAYLAGQTGAGVAYTAAKHALLGVMRWAARALAPEVRVNGVAPGGVVTDLRAVEPSGAPGRALFADADEKRALVAGRNLLGTVLEPSELAPYFVFLASDAAKGMTGEVLRPDGGLDLR